MDLVNTFESKLDSALTNRFKDENEIYQEMVKSSYLGRINISQFVDIYINSIYNKNNPEINEKIIKTLMDIKLQLLFMLPFEISRYNDIENGDLSKILKNDWSFLEKLSVDQNMINKTRIFWERVMNFVYLLANQKELQSKRSKKAKFKKFVSENKEWDFLNVVISKIEAFDNAFRTPEVHKFSRLRSMFIEGNNMEVERYCFNLISTFNNETYANIIDLLKGRRPSSFSWEDLPKNNDKTLEAFYQKSRPHWEKEIE